MASSSEKFDGGSPSPGPSLLTVVVLVAGAEATIYALMHALLSAGAVVFAVAVTVAMVVAATEAVILPAAVAAGSAVALAVLVAPSAAPFADVAVAAGAAVATAAAAMAVAAASGLPRRWLWRRRQSLRLCCEIW